MTTSTTISGNPADDLAGIDTAPSAPRGQREPLADFLRGLSHTGALGFEGLVTRLLEAETGQRFRIAGSGFQAGMDSGSEMGGQRANRIKAETKHYFSSSLSLRELTAEIVQAAKASDFDLWVLGASCAIHAQHTTELEAHAAERGIECLFLDRPETGLARLEVLMAAHPEVVERFGEASGSVFEKTALRAALSSVETHPEFVAARAQLRAKLSGTLLGYDDACRRAKTEFLAVLSDAGSAEAVFNQEIAIRAQEVRVITRRSVEEALTAWWTQDALHGRHGAILGEEGQGKSWAVFAWAADRIENSDLPLVLPFNASAQLIERGSTIETILPDLLARWTRRADCEHWERRLAGWLEEPQEREPLLFIIADGLNEQAGIDWIDFFRPMRHERWRGRILVLATDRPGHWRPNCVRLERDGFMVLPIQGYSDRELSEALAGRNIQLSDVPAGLHALIRTPRYCGLVADHFEEMKQSDDFTRERLILLDIKHRQDTKRGFPLSVEAFTEIIQGLAQRFRQQAELQSDDIKAILPGVDPTRQVYQEIIDGGLLIKVEAGLKVSYIVERTRLVFGLGMLLAEDTRTAASCEVEAAAISESIARWLEPHADMDLKVEVCAATIFHALLDPDYPVTARQELIRYWLSTRNRFEDSDEAQLAFVLRIPEDFLAIVESFWSSTCDRGAAQSYLAMAFCQHRADPRLKPLLIEAVGRWMGLVHPAGPRLLRGMPGGEAERQRTIALRIGQVLTPGTFEIVGERLTVIDDDGLLRLSRFGLLLMSAGERAPFIRSLASWAVASAVMGAALEKDVAAWVVRLSDEDLDTYLIPEARRLLETGDAIGFEAGHTLLDVLGTKAAYELKAHFPKAESAEVKERHAAHEANPCTSLYSWSDSECEYCLNYPETPINLILHRATDELLDPRRQLAQHVVGRIVDSLNRIDPATVHASFNMTSEQHHFDDLRHAAAAQAPEKLADFIRAVVKTMPARNLEGRRQLALWLPQIYPVLQAPEVESIRGVLTELRSGATMWQKLRSSPENASQTAEAFAVWGLLPKLDRNARYTELMSRPVEAFDFDDMDIWFGPLGERAIQEALSVIHEPHDNRFLVRALWILGSAGVSLKPNDKDRLVALAADQDEIVRAVALRFACLTENSDLGRRMVDLGRRYDSPGDTWETHWGARLLIKYSFHVPFDVLITRVNAATASYLLQARGCPPDEVRTYATSVNALWRDVTGAPEPNIEVETLPEIQLKPGDGRLGTEIPTISDEDRSGRTFRDSSTSWTSGDGGSHEDFFRDIGRDIDLEVLNAEAASKRDAIVAAWRSQALKSFGRSFSPTALTAICSAMPEAVHLWVTEAVDYGPVGRSARIRLGSFYFHLCEALLRVDPELGLKLWTALQNRGSAIHFDVAEILFRAPRSRPVDEARAIVLKTSVSDFSIAHLAYLAQMAGDEWLDEQIEQLIGDASLGRRALGLSLASFSHHDSDSFEDFVKRADIEATWVEEILPTIRRNHYRDLWARTWCERFLNESSEDRSWAAFQVSVHLADERLLFWLPQAREAQRPPADRENLVSMSWQEVKRMLDRRKEREDHLYGIKTLKGEIFPFISWRS